MASQPKAKNAHKVSKPHLADPANTTSNISLLSTRRKVLLPCVLRKLSRTFQLGEEENADLEQVAAGIDRMIPFSHFQRNLVSRSINQLIVMMHREQQMQQRLTRGMLLFSNFHEFISNVLLAVQTRQCTCLLGAWCPEQDCSSFRCHGTCRLPRREIRCHSEFGRVLSAGKMLMKFSGWSSIRMRRWNGSEAKMYRASTGPRTRRKRALCPWRVRLLELKSNL